MMEEVMPSYQSKIPIIFLLLGIFLILDISWGRRTMAISNNTVSLRTLEGYVDGVVV
jgi:hypothetical protein